MVDLPMAVEQRKSLVREFRSLADRALERAAKRGDETAIYLEHDSAISYGAIFTEAMALASGLNRLGFVKGDVLSFQLPNWRETVAIDIACCWLGLVLNPIVPIYRDNEVRHILADCRAKAIFIPDSYRNFNYAEMIAELKSELPLLEQVIIVRGDATRAAECSYASLVNETGAYPAQAAIAPDDTKIIMYTSGTTGKAKAVYHSHSSLAHAIFNGVDGWGLAEGDIMLMPSPVTHITGYANGIELPFFSEAKAAFMERWNVDAAVAYIERIKATFCVSATPFLQELVEKAKSSGCRLHSLRAFACGGAAVPPSLITTTRDVLENCRAFRVYGCTEAPLISVGFIGEDELLLAANTDGRVFNWDVKIIDDNNDELGLGCDGEVIVKGPAMMAGYGEESQTAQSVDSHGYFHTGDIGHLTPEGAIVITDRKKDIIIRGGENLSAREIEDVLYKHPLVLEAAVVAMPHARLGEGVCALLVTRDGTKPSLAELIPFFQQVKLAKQKWPERVEYRTEMPKTPSGKIKKDILRKEVVQNLSSTTA